MKKSLQNTIKEAKTYSKNFPNTIVYVVDKYHCKPKMYTIGWLAMHAINCEGYYPVATFKNGKRHDIKED